MMKCVEENSGLGELTLNDGTRHTVQYRVTRLQGFVEGSGLPIPGLHRIEGSIDYDAAADPYRTWLGVPLKLTLEDGRIFGITLVDIDGRILSEGHGPSKCLCC